MKPVLAYPWSLTDATGAKASMSGFAAGRLQEHEVPAFRAASPYAEVWLHVSLNSIRMFSGAWRERDATQVAPSPENARPWPIAHHRNVPIPEVFYDVRDRRVQVEAAEWLLSRWPPTYDPLMIDDVQVTPGYLHPDAYGPWAEGWTRIIHRLKAEGYRVGVNLWPLSHALAGPIRAMADCVLIERFAPSAVRTISQLPPDREIWVNWQEPPAAPNVAARTAAQILSTLRTGGIGWSVDDGKGRQYHPSAVSQMAATT